MGLLAIASRHPVGGVDVGWSPSLHLSPWRPRLLRWRRREWRREKDRGRGDS